MSKLKCEVCEEDFLLVKVVFGAAPYGEKDWDMNHDQQKK